MRVSFGEDDGWRRYARCVATVAAAGHSRKQIDKAGKLLRDVVLALGGESDLDPDRFTPDSIREAVDVVQWWRGQHARPLARVTALLRYYADKVGGESVTQRLKRFSTIVDKLQRQPTMALSKMEDIAGVRAILSRQEDVDRVVRCLERSSSWKIRRIRRYVDGGVPGPKDDGYRAVHVVVQKDGCYVEMQLRTPWQDSWAQSVEQDTRRLRAGLKFGSGPDDLRDYYRMISELFAMRERMIDPSEEFMEDLAKLYAATRDYFPSNGEDAPR